MINSWYDSLTGSDIYHLFLRHRRWTAGMILRTHVFYCFPLFVLGLVWFIVPMSTASIPMIVAFHSQPWLGMALALAMLLCIVLLWPIMGLLFGDLFYGYLAGLFNIFRGPEAARRFAQSTQHDLEDWKAAHD